MCNPVKLIKKIPLNKDKNAVSLRNLVSQEADIKNEVVHNIEKEVKCLFFYCTCIIYT